MTKNEFLELKNKHSYEKQYKVKDENELKELVKLAEIIDVHMDLNWLDVSNVTNMNSLFYNSKFNGDISKWNVSNVKDMCCMFDNSEFNGNISKWNVSNVTSMAYMLRNSKFNGDISKWNVSKVTNANFFNPYLGINNKEDLNNYMSFLNSIYNNKPLKVDIKKEWLKTKDLPLYIANKMNKDKEFIDNIKKLLCSRVGDIKND